MFVSPYFSSKDCNGSDNCGKPTAIVTTDATAPNAVIIFFPVSVSNKSSLYFLSIAACPSACSIDSTIDVAPDILYSSMATVIFLK